LVLIAEKLAVQLFGDNEYAPASNAISIISFSFLVGTPMHPATS